MSCSTPLHSSAHARLTDTNTNTCTRTTVHIVERNGRVRVFVNRRQVYSGLRLLSFVEANSDGVWINGAMIVCALDEETVNESVFV